MRPINATIFKNLGLILQVNGLFNIIPVAFAITLGEEPQTIGLFLASFASLAIGFFLSNVKGEEKADYASLSILVVVSFVVLGAIGSIPYLYLHSTLFPTASITTKIVSSYFESISAMTTTGLTLFSDPSILPRSIMFYRAVTQWLGGVGIVFFMLLFLNAPGTYTGALEAFGGYAKLATTARGTYLRVMQIYAMYTALFVILLITLGFMEPFSAVIVSLTGISTGGMIHTANLATELNPASFWLSIILMITGAISFPIHARVWNRKIRGAFSVEFKTFVIYLVVVSSLTIVLANSANWADSWVTVFHTVSAATTTGFQFIPLDTESPAIRLILTLAMFVGGCSFSTAGGVKVIRMMIAFRSIAWLARSNALPNSAVTSVKIGKDVFFEKEIAVALTIILSAATLTILTSVILMLGGYPFLNSLFESVSAFTGTGLTAGIVSLQMPSILQVSLIINMIAGKLEVIPVLITVRALYRYLTRKETIDAMLRQEREIFR